MKSLEQIAHDEDALARSKRERCRHANADHMFAGDFWDDAAEACFGPYEAKCEQLRCLDCGAWLSLGPSNDDGRRVQDEIEAARILPSMKQSSDPWFVVASAEAACVYKGNHDECDVCPALWLAAAIASHEEGE